MNTKGESVMKKIIPFKKDIIFKTNISEITSISLEHTLSSDEDNAITGNFIVSGDYKISDESIHTEAFSYDLPFDIHLDEKYDLSHAIIDIDDFYYEIVNNNLLSLNIDVLIDKLEEKLIPEELQEVVIPRENILEEDRVFTLDETLEEKMEEQSEENEIIEEPRCIEPEEIIEENPVFKKETSTKIEEKSLQRDDIQIPSEITSLFDNIDASSETYKSYKVYIVREGDDLEFIMEKYATTKEIIEQYNDLNELKIGDKIIIPSQNETA